MSDSSVFDDEWIALRAEVDRLRAIENRAKALAEKEPITQDDARRIGIARYILTGQKH